MGSRLSTLSNERDIINSLKATPKTQQALADELGIHYYTVRRIIKGLVERGVAKTDGMIDRAAVYAYVGDETEGDYIPRLTDIVNRVSVKSVYLTESIGREDSMKSVLASKRLPHHIIELMMLAQQSSTGAILGDKLDRLREQITKDFLYLKNAASMYEQILQEPRYWDAKHLAKMVEDPDYNFAIISQAWEYVHGDD